MKVKTGILIVNLGSPNAPKFWSVYTYLTQFLNDPRVIDLPLLLRLFLVNVIIIPLRCAASTKAYQQLWTDEGSPLIYWTRIQQELLQKKMPPETKVYMAMRYQNPSLESVVAQMKDDGIAKMIVIPLFPQYASASTGSVMDKVMDLVKDWWAIPDIHIISDFYDHPKYIEAIANRTTEFKFDDYDHILFSYHGLPLRQLDKVYDNGACTDHSCNDEINESNSKCYMAQCYATTRALAAKLDIDKSRYTVCFQSRLDKKWIEPFADKTIIALAKEGKKKLLVFSPAFVADCLETTVEISEEYLELFQEHGGETLDLVPGINDDTAFIDCLEDLVKMG